jgi:hypothetical protein
MNCGIRMSRARRRFSQQPNVNWPPLPPDPSSLNQHARQRKPTKNPTRKPTNDHNKALKTKKPTGEEGRRLLTDTTRCYQNQHHPTRGRLLIAKKQQLKNGNLLWWGRADLNHRPLPRAVHEHCSYGFLLTAPEPLHPFLRSVNPSLHSGARRHTCLDYDPTYY